MSIHMNSQRRWKSNQFEEKLVLQSIYISGKSIKLPKKTFNPNFHVPDFLM